MHSGLRRVERAAPFNVIIPMTLTVAIAYEVRKLLSRESIYTFKLVRRGHRIPDTLTTNVYSSYSAADLMNTHISSVPASTTQTGLSDKAATQPDIEYFLLEEKGKITGISSRGLETVRDFCTISKDFTLLASIERMNRSGVQIAVVSSDGTLAASQVRGIITRKHLDDILAESVERYNEKF